MTYEIYLITNQINNKKYVGQTISTKGYQARFLQHCCIARYDKRKGLLHKAMNKYGEENFTVELIAENVPESKVDYYEQYWIKHFNTLAKNGQGYNITIGGQGVHGYKHTLDTILKISESGKQYWEDLKKDNPEKYEYLCKLRSDNLKGIKKSEESKLKCSKAAKERFKKEPGTFKGKKHSEESKNLVSIANGQRVGMFDIKTDDLIKEFQSAVKATEYLIEIGKTTNKYANARILEICNGNGKSAYGFTWKRL